MYVCICKAVSDRRIREVVADGTTTLRALRELTGLGTCCGKCVPQAYALLRDSVADSTPAQPVPMELAARSA